MINLTNLKKLFLSFLTISVISGSMFVALIPQTASAATDVSDCSQGFLGFPAWYRGLVEVGTDGSCNVTSPSGDGLSNFIWHIILNIVEDVMMLVGYITVAFILYGGFQFLISQGSPDAAAKARTTILNAVVGLVMSIVAVGVVNFIVTGILK